MDRIKIKSLCYGNSCCPEASINSDGSVTLTEGVFCLTIQRESAEILTELLLEAGYGKSRDE